MNNQLHLEPIDIDWVKANFDKESFERDFKPDKENLDRNISKSLYLGNNIIGYCLIKPCSMLEIIKRIIYWIKAFGFFHQNMIYKQISVTYLLQEID